MKNTVFVMLVLAVSTIVAGCTQEPSEVTLNGASMVLKRGEHTVTARVVERVDRQFVVSKMLANNSKRTLGYHGIATALMRSPAERREFDQYLKTNKKCSRGAFSGQTAILVARDKQAQADIQSAMRKIGSGGGKTADRKIVYRLVGQRLQVNSYKLGDRDVSKHTGRIGESYLIERFELVGKWQG